MTPELDHLILLCIELLRVAAAVLSRWPRKIDARSHHTGLSLPQRHGLQRSAYGIARRPGNSQDAQGHQPPLPALQRLPEALSRLPPVTTGHFLSPSMAPGMSLAPTAKSTPRPPEAPDASATPLQDHRMNRVNVRLTLGERAMIEQLQAALATPLMPHVTASDVLRAGLVALSHRLATQRPEAA